MFARHYGILAGRLDSIREMQRGGAPGGTSIVGDSARLQRWSIPPGARPALARVTLLEIDTSSLALTAPPVAIDPAHVLLRWTDALDDERALSLWVGQIAAADPEVAAASLARWIDWAGVTPPPGVTLEHLAAATRELVSELDAIAREPDHVSAYDEYDRRAVTRAMRAWVRAHEKEPAAVLGGVRAVLRAESLGSITPAIGNERAALVNTLRRNLDRAPSAQSATLLEVLMRLDAQATVFAPFAESVLDFLLLDGEMRSGYPRELATLATLPAWSNTIRLGLAAAGRGAVRAARMLLSLAAHREVARGLSADASHQITEHLVRAIAHPRMLVWSRAARAMGRLAGALPDLPAELEKLLDPPTPATLRRRALVALGNLAPGAGDKLADLRRKLLANATDGGIVASLALGLTDRITDADESWPDTVRSFAARGGPETWATLALALREIATRSPEHATITRSLARELRSTAEATASAGDAELMERTLLVTGRIIGEEFESATPWTHAAELAARIAANPSDAALVGAAEEFIAHTDNAIASALRAVSQDQPRVSARGSILLEEVVDLVVHGDVAVLGERIVDGATRASMIAYAESLRGRLLRAMLTGLRRAAPTTLAWRRWLLRTAAVLPRIEPAGVEGSERERIVREQVFDALARVADDVTIQQQALQRLTATALGELGEVVRSPMIANVMVALLAWVAVRGNATPARPRQRRAFSEEISAEGTESLFALFDGLRTGRNADEQLLLLAKRVGDGCRLGRSLAKLHGEVLSMAARGPEMHWSGLPRLELAELPRIADEMLHVRDDPSYALTLHEAQGAPPSGESLVERAAKLNRTLTSTSLKFLDAGRRAEVVDHYVTELNGLCEAIATACGPLAGTPVRAVLAKALVAVRTMAGNVVRERSDNVRYIGRLRVTGALSSAHEGGMTNTYMAEGPAPGKRVVVKLLPWERFVGSSAAQARALFEREMQRLAPIVHPNICSIIDAGFVDEGAYIAIELIPGASMETLLSKFGKVSLPRLGPIVRDVARGLAHLHARGIVHRDIKPGNILVQIDRDDRAGALTTEEWERGHFIRAVVIDLGIATDPEGTGDGSDESGIVGTPGYLAPEVARGLGTITPAIDVYALAVVVFEALTGVNPYLEGEPEMPALLVRHGTMTLPLEDLPDAAHKPALLHLLAESCKIDPTARPTMREFLDRWVAAFRG